MDNVKVNCLGDGNTGGEHSMEQKSGTQELAYDPRKLHPNWIYLDLVISILMAFYWPYQVHAFVQFLIMGISLVLIRLIFHSYGLEYGPNFNSIYLMGHKLLENKRKYLLVGASIFILANIITCCCIHIMMVILFWFAVSLLVLIVSGTVKVVSVDWNEKLNRDDDNSLRKESSKTFALVPNEEELDMLKQAANAELSLSEPVQSSQDDDIELSKELPVDKLKRYTRNLIDKSSSSSEENITDLISDKITPPKLSTDNTNSTNSPDRTSPGNSQKIEFTNEYFNNSSSNSCSDDEEGLTKGLNFTAFKDGVDSPRCDITEDQKAVSAPAETTSNSSNVTNLVSNLVSWGLENMKKLDTGGANQQSKLPKQSSNDGTDESDFEILDKDELISHST